MLFRSILREVNEALMRAGIAVAYVAIVDDVTMAPYDGVGAARVIVAGTIEGVRLLDNAVVVLQRGDETCC